MSTTRFSQAAVRLGLVLGPPRMRNVLIISAAAVGAYLLGLAVLIVILLCVGSLPPWLNACARFVYAPVLYVLDQVFGGICC